MIKNSELYDFTDEEENLQSEAEPLETISAPEQRVPGRLLSQTVVAVLFLIIVLLTGKVHQSWTKWIRVQIHHAVNAPTEATFGRIWKYPALQSLIQSSRQWVRLENNNPLTTPGATNTNQNQNNTIAGTAWPVTGRITRKFGWGYNATTRRNEYFQGIEITALPEADVYAFADGEVTEVLNQPEQGWSLTIDHGNGWKAVYHHLAKVWVTAGQSVKSGATIARLERLQPLLRLEVFNQGRPVDPSTLLK